MRAIWAIALNTIRDALRRKVLLVVALHAACLAATLWLMPVITEEARVSLVNHMSLGLATFFGTVVAIFLAGWTTPAEIERREIYSVLSKPVRRVEVLAGKLFGLFIVLAVLVGVMLALGCLGVRYTAWRVAQPVRLARPLLPVSVTAQGQGGARWESDHLWVRLGTTDVGQLWELPVSGAPPAPLEQVPVRLHISWLAGKPRWTPPSDEELAQRDRVRLHIEAFDAKEQFLWQVEQEVELQYVFQIRDPVRVSIVRRLEGALELPGPARSLARLRLTVLGTEPTYSPPPVRWYGSWEQVRWRFEGIPEAITDEADARVGLTIGQFGTGSRGVDNLLRFTNPQTGESRTVQVPLKDNLAVRFVYPRDMVSQDGRLEVTWTGSAENVNLGLRRNEPSLTLRQRPVALEWGYMKAAALILGQLMLIAAIALTVSTVASGPIAVLVALATWFAGTSAGFVKEYAEAVTHAERAAQRGVHTHGTDTLSGWFGTIMDPLIKLEAKVVPDFAHFAAAPHLVSGMDVPNRVMRDALAHASIYLFGAILVGWLLFRWREFR